MRVVFISRSDFSNYCANMAEALRTVGYDADAYTLSSHRFKYNKQAAKVSHETMRKKAREADVVIIGHSEPALLDMCKGKRVMALHTGTPFRQNYERLNPLFNDVVERTFVDSPEFMTLGCINPTYLCTSIDTDAIKFRPTHNNHTIFAHYPSNALVKGTHKIKEMMSAYKCDFRCDTLSMTHEQNLRRMQVCDVYIELFAPTQNGKPYGSFGVQALEAAALGKIVVTNSLFHDVYEQAYGTSTLYVCNTEYDFRFWIEGLMKAPRETIEESQRLSRQWVDNKHSYKATGTYLSQYL